MAHQGGRPGRFGRRTLLPAAGAALVSADLAATARPRPRRPTVRPIRDRTVGSATGTPPLLAVVRRPHGRHQLHLPPASCDAPGPADPVFLLDHECRDATHRLRFHDACGPAAGILLRRRCIHYLAVTVEHRRLVLTGCSQPARVLAHAPWWSSTPAPTSARGRLRAHAAGACAGATLQHAPRGAAPAPRRTPGCCWGRADEPDRSWSPLPALGSAVSTPSPQPRCSSPAPRGERRDHRRLRARLHVPPRSRFESSSDPSFTRRGRTVDRAPAGPPFTALDQGSCSPTPFAVHSAHARFVTTDSRAVGSTRAQQYTPRLGSRPARCVGPAWCAIYRSGQDLNG